MNSFFSWLLRPVPLGILVTLATMFSAFYTARQQQTLVTSLEQTRLEQLATLAKARVSARIEDYISLCLGLRNLFVLNPAVNRAEFARAVENLQLRDRFPEIKNVAFSRYLAASERAAFEERVRTDTSLDPKGYPDFSIHPPGERSEYFVADYLWPMAGNERIHGLDISAQPVNLLSMRHSRDTAQPVASGPFDLLQEQSERTGFVVRVPVFITAAEGGSGFLGSVAVTTRVLDMVHWLTLHENLGELSLTLTDLGSNLPGFDLASGPGASRLLYAPKPSEPAVSTISRALQIEVYGRTWQLEVQPILPLLSAAERNLPRSIQIVGGTIALLLGWLAYFLARSRASAEQREQSANLAVQRSEERFRSLLRDIPTVAVQGYRADGTTTFWNRASERIYGYRAEEALGRNLIDLIIPPELRDAVRNDIQTMVDTGTPAPVAELALQRKDGTRVSVLTSHAVVQRLDDAPELFCLDVELTNLKLAQEALESVQQADRAKDAFLATISHELRTPLSAVLGLSELAAHQTREARTKDALGKIHAAGQTLKHLIDDLLDLSRILAGKLEFEHIPFALRPLVDKVGTILQGAVQAKGLTLSITFDHDVPDFFLGDPLRVEQILLNLLGNAVKFTPKGRVALHGSVFDQKERQIGLQLEVSDEGIGMTEEEVARLFQPFMQADASMSRRYGGSGLGLAICQQLARQMDGAVSVRSVKGAGSRFTVRIWLERTDPAAGSPPSADPGSLPVQEQLRFHNVRLLLAEDQPVNREIVESLLDMVGITFSTVSNGQEALDLLTDQGPQAFDLVLMDVQMPVLDGISATRILRSTPGFEHLPVIAITAHTMRHEVEKCLDAGMSDQIGKPFDSQSFYATLARWIPEDRQKRTLAPELPEAARPASTPERLDPALSRLPSLCAAAALARFGGKEARYRHWLDDFRSEAPEALERIVEAVANAQTDSARKGAHALKGRAGMLGAMAVHQAASELEAALQAGRAPPGAIEQLRATIFALCSDLASLAPANEPSPAYSSPDVCSDPRLEPLPACIAELVAMLEASDGRALRQLESCLTELAHSTWTARLDAAAERLRIFDFDGAKSCLENSR